MADQSNCGIITRVLVSRSYRSLPVTDESPVFCFLSCRKAAKSFATTLAWRCHKLVNRQRCSLWKQLAEIIHATEGIRQPQDAHETDRPTDLELSYR